MSVYRISRFLSIMRPKPSLAAHALERNASKQALDRVLANNKAWVARKTHENPTFFTDLASKQQAPRYLFIGCSDSRVNANEITGLEAGEVFVHRNIANMVVHTDINLLSILQFAIGTLGVRDIIVCGHYGCGGVAAAMKNTDFGLLDNWLRNIRDGKLKLINGYKIVSRMHVDELISIKDAEKRNERLIELNVQEQCINLFKNGMVQNFQIKYGYPRIHGLVYDIRNGKLKKLPVDFKAYAAKYESIYSLYENVSGNVQRSQAHADFLTRNFGKDTESVSSSDFFKAVFNKEEENGNAFTPDELVELMSKIEISNGGMVNLVQTRRLLGII